MTATPTPLRAMTSVSPPGNAQVGAPVERLVFLDGLRGLAALVIVVHQFTADSGHREIFATGLLVRGMRYKLYPGLVVRALARIVLPGFVVTALNPIAAGLGVGASLKFISSSGRQ